MKKLCLILLFVPLLLSANTWQPYLEGKGRFGDFKNGGGAALFIPARQNNCSLTFIQLQGGYFRRFYEGNGGLGYRKLTQCNTAWGLNGFIDVSRSLNGKVFQQFGLGAEYFTRCMTFRANGYIPSYYGANVTGQEIKSTVIDSQPAELIFNRIRHAFIGFDLTAGYGCDICCGQFWGYLGYFLYDNPESSIQTGPRVRLEYKLCDLFRQGTELIVASAYEWSRVHGNSVAGILEVRFPLYLLGNPCRGCPGPCCVGNIRRRMGEPVRREDSMWVDWPKDDLRLDDIIIL